MNGQERRAWLDRQGQNALDTLQYYLGPGVNVNALATLGDMFNPVADIGRAGTAARGVVRPGATAMERVNALGNVATDMASVLAPVAGAAYADDAARGLTEALANWSMPADDAVGRFVLDEDGAIRAWHGSPHDFDRFSMDKIGTGEGAQAYGHGLYFAERPGVAKAYQEALSRPYYQMADGRSVADVYGQDVVDAFTNVGGDPAEISDTIARLRSIVARDLAEFGVSDVSQLTPFVQYQGDVASNAIDMARRADGLEALLKSDNVRRVNEGRLYEVNIDANPEDFLDWDAPLSAQPEAIQRAFGGIVDRDLSQEPGWAKLTGEQALAAAVERAGRKRQGETALREAGIPGIRYLDAGSRGAGDGSRNYVVFDDRLIDVLGKDGVRTTPQGKAQDVLDMLKSGRASEVTDDMLDLGDPVLNAQLNDYLFRNYDLPMDEASRMARAREMGFDTETPLYHGGTSNLKAVSRFDGTAEAGQDGLFSTSSPRVANTYAKSRSMADAGMGGHNVTPLYGRTGDYRQAGYTVPFPADGTDAEVNAWMAGLDRFNRRLDADGAKPAYFQSQADAARAAGQPGAVIREVEDNRIASGFVEPSDVYMTLDPTSVRSRFARFDPRLAHLRNLSAGVGGLGIAVSQQSEQERSDDINDILAKYGVN